MENSTDKRKRVDDEFDETQTHCVDSVHAKIRKINSFSDSDDVNLTETKTETQLTRVDSSESSQVFDSDEIFNILDDENNAHERDSEPDSVMGLDSVIKSFEEEIFAPGTEPGLTEPEPVQVDLVQMTGSGEMEMNLGYLFEASDDELGLPPTVTEPGLNEPGSDEPDKVDLTGFVGFDDDFTGFDGFGYGTGLLSESDGGAEDFVTGDGLFEYGEPAAADVLWRSESLQAM
ncbi:hypothetical protein MtrunA17_Chr6g0484631 [Medicago truncatula]|uniref:Uncharacterized protein n=1 Tax=Medicago truncatula TaxID=3880 RepID=A0A072UD80_MEDTR|nr:uncharacterized protein LOC25496852 [Medicago truncatula]KEH27043.1 hypothetical protein MTR_6g084600 [Medicago truncatula]RHN52817.1 hypothetical protein MtrunA17_Chr6g0484631 [Medicago truncatula]